MLKFVVEHKGATIISILYALPCILYACPLSGLTVQHVYNVTKPIQAAMFRGQSEYHIVFISSFTTLIYLVLCIKCHIGLPCAPERLKQSSFASGTHQNFQII